MQHFSQIVPRVNRLQHFIIIIINNKLNNNREANIVIDPTLHLLYPFSGVHLGTRPLESRRQVSCQVFINFLPLGSQTLGCYEVYYY